MPTNQNINPDLDIISLGTSLYRSPGNLYQKDSKEPWSTLSYYMEKPVDTIKWSFEYTSFLENKYSILYNYNAPFSFAPPIQNTTVIYYSSPVSFCKSINPEPNYKYSTNEIKTILKNSVNYVVNAGQAIYQSKNSGTTLNNNFISSESLGVKKKKISFDGSTSNIILYNLSSTNAGQCDIRKVCPEDEIITKDGIYYNSSSSPQNTKNTGINCIRILDENNEEITYTIGSSVIINYDDETKKDTMHIIVNMWIDAGDCIFLFFRDQKPYPTDKFLAEVDNPFEFTNYLSGSGVKLNYPDLQTKPVYDMGNGGTISLYRTEMHPQGLSPKELDNFLNDDSFGKDYSGIFDYNFNKGTILLKDRHHSAAFTSANFPSSYKTSNYVSPYFYEYFYAIQGINYQDIIGSSFHTIPPVNNVLDIIANNPNRYLIYPFLVLHDSITFILSDTEDYLYEPVTISEVSSSGYYHISGYYMISGDILKKNKDGTMVSVYEDVYVSDSLSKYEGDRGNIAKYIYRGVEFNSEAVQKLLTTDKHFPLDDSKIREYSPVNAFASNLNMSSDWYILNGEFEAGDIVYIKGKFAKNRYSRNILQVHTGLPTDNNLQHYSSLSNPYNDQTIVNNYTKGSIYSFYPCKMFDVDEDIYIDIWRMSEIDCNNVSVDYPLSTRNTHNNSFLVLYNNLLKFNKNDNSSYLKEDGTKEAVFYALDIKGIVQISVDIYGKFYEDVLYSPSSLNQNWFKAYLSQMNLATIDNNGNIIPNPDNNGIIVSEDLRDNSDNLIQEGGYLNIEISSLLFDISDYTNKICKDNEKIAYLKEFALAIKALSDIKEPVGKKIGDIKRLDLIDYDIEEDDLSYSVFKSNNHQGFYEIIKDSVIIENSIEDFKNKIYIDSESGNSYEKEYLDRIKDAPDTIEIKTNFEKEVTYGATTTESYIAEQYDNSGNGTINIGGGVPTDINTSDPYSFDISTVWRDVPFNESPPPTFYYTFQAGDMPSELSLYVVSNVGDRIQLNSNSSVQLQLFPGQQCRIEGTYYKSKPYSLVHEYINQDLVWQQLCSITITPSYTGNIDSYTGYGTKWTWYASRIYSSDGTLTYIAQNTGAIINPYYYREDYFALPYGKYNLTIDNNQNYKFYLTYTDVLGNLIRKQITTSIDIVNGNRQKYMIEIIYSGTHPDTDGFQFTFKCNEQIIYPFSSGKWICPKKIGIKRRINSPAIFNEKYFKGNTNFYIESFGIERVNDQSRELDIQDFTNVSSENLTLFYSNNIFPDWPIEYMSMFFGPIHKNETSTYNVSIASAPNRQYYLYTQYLPDKNSLSYFTLSSYCSTDNKCTGDVTTSYNLDYESEFIYTQKDFDKIRSFYLDSIDRFSIGSGQYWYNIETKQYELFYYYYPDYCSTICYSGYPNSDFSLPSYYCSFNSVNGVDNYSTEKYCYPNGLLINTVDGAIFTGAYSDNPYYSKDITLSKKDGLLTGVIPSSSNDFDYIRNINIKIKEGLNPNRQNPYINIGFNGDYYVDYGFPSAENLLSNHIILDNLNSKEQYSVYDRYAYKYAQYDPDYPETFPYVCNGTVSRIYETNSVSKIPTLYSGNKNIDVRFSQGGLVSIQGDISSIDKTAKVQMLKKDVYNKYRTYGDSCSAVIDSQQNYYIFYEDYSTNPSDFPNISVVVSHDKGNTWIKHNNIIRLVQGESAKKPYCIFDYKNDIVYLLFLMNDRFVAIKKIELFKIKDSDSFLDYFRPCIFDEETNDKDGLDQFSEFGISMRQELIYLIAGNAYFKDDNVSRVLEELDINTKRIKGNKKCRIKDALLDYKDSKSFIVNDLQDISFAGYIDSLGVLRVFYTIDNKDALTSVINSYNKIDWSYSIKNFYMHKPTPDDIDLFPNKTINDYKTLISNSITYCSSFLKRNTRSEIQITYDDIQDSTRVNFYSGAHGGYTIGYPNKFFKYMQENIDIIYNIIQGDTEDETDEIKIIMKYFYPEKTIQSSGGPPYTSYLLPNGILKGSPPQVSKFYIFNLPTE